MSMTSLPRILVSAGTPVYCFLFFFKENFFLKKNISVFFSSLPHIRFVLCVQQNAAEENVFCGYSCSVNTHVL